MNIDLFGSMFYFLSKYKDRINKNIQHNLKCKHCNYVIIDAQVVECGCLYCRTCLNKMKEYGVEKCPGPTRLCKNIHLSSNHPDIRVNQEISDIVIKCPEEMCFHECTIINMGEHLRVCEKKSVKCPFAIFGCDDKNLTSEMINDHCQSANFNHGKLLIELIENLKNEIVQMKTKGEIDQIEFVEFRENLKSNTELINILKFENGNLKRELNLLKQNSQENVLKIDEKINKEINKIMKEQENTKNKIDKTLSEIENENIQLIISINKQTDNIKRDNEMMKKEFNLTINQLKDEIDKINKSILKLKDDNIIIKYSLQFTNEIRKQIVSINVEINQLKQNLIDVTSFSKLELEQNIGEINKKFDIEHEKTINIKEYVETKMKEINNEMQNIDCQLNNLFQNATKSIIKIMMDTNKKSEKKLNEFTKFIELKYPLIQWMIDKLNKKKIDKCVESEFFSCISKQYKLRLSINADGCDQVKRKSFSIYLNIYPSDYDEFLSWPFSADVTIKIVSKTNANKNKSFTKYCKIDKPQKNFFSRSDPFNYLYSDLTNDGIILWDNCFIECYININSIIL